MTRSIFYTDELIKLHVAPVSSRALAPVQRGIAGEVARSMSMFSAWHGTPADVQAALFRWAVLGMPPGTFCSCVLQDRLFASYQHANAGSLEAMPAIIQFVAHVLPRSCWGSVEHFGRWLAWHQDLPDNPLAPRP